MEKKESLSGWRRLWAVLAIIFSVVVLLLAVTGTVGVWVGRGVAIDFNDSLMDGIDQLAGVGRDGATRIGNGVGEIQTVVGEVESAVDEVAQSVSDKGLVMTLLPPEKEQKIVDAAEEVSEIAGTITSAVEAAFELYAAIDDIPLINLPKPDEAKVEALDANIQEMQDSVDQLAKDIQEFRDGAASEVGKISAAAGEVNARLDETNANLNGLDGELASLQTRAGDFKGRFRTMATIAAIVVSLTLIWVIYAMVILIMKYWAELKA